MAKRGKTFNTTYRGDIRDIATIARWMQTQGVIPQTQTELVNVAVTNFVEMLHSRFPECRILEVGDALAYLQELGILGDKQIKKAHTALSADNWANVNASAGSTSMDSQLATKAGKKAIEDTAQNAVELMKAMERRKEKDAQLEAALGNMPAGLVVEEEEE